MAASASATDLLPTGGWPLAVFATTRPFSPPLRRATSFTIKFSEQRCVDLNFCLKPGLKLYYLLFKLLHSESQRVQTWSCHADMNRNARNEGYVHEVIDRHLRLQGGAFGLRYVAALQTECIRKLPVVTIPFLCARSVDNAPQDI